MASISKDLENCISNIPDSTSGGFVDWVITVNDGYEFDEVPMIYFQDNDFNWREYPFKLSPDFKKATYSNMLELYGAGHISVTAQTKVSENVGFNIILNKSLSNCVSNIPDTINSNDGFIVDWIITAKENHVIEEQPKGVYYDNETLQWAEFPFIIEDNGNKATYKGSIDIYNSFSSEQSINIEAIAIEKEIVTVNYGSINAYSVTMDDLSSFAGIRFIEDESESADLIDLGDYVRSIKRTYYNVPVASNTNLFCGNYDTGISVESLAESIIKLDFGGVVLPLHNNNVSDFDNTEISLFLPFVGFTDVSTDYLGTELRVLYEIDVISSVGVVKLFSDEMLIQTINCEPFADIIYRKSDELDGVIGKLNSNYFLLYGLEPFVKIKWHVNLDNEIYQADNRRSKIGDLRGYNKLNDVEYSLISDNVTYKEVELIKQVLNNGILII